MFFRRNTTSQIDANLPKEIEENKGVIIDCRTSPERATGVLPNAIGSDWLAGQFQTQSKEWDPNKHYYLYCRSGSRSGQATQFLKAQGFANVTNIGGYGSLKDLF